ncbi:DoxX-like family protein [Alkalicoccobacillus gibsonii]|uniref:DoxX-like family protein n=1 Tax=Alkalicoccobacillus gibsonii TaxID=79881 RepID=A0ABU9VDJ9_9BACI
MKSKPIYVELPIKAPLEQVWQATQEPERHQQWDLRFSSITYLPKEAGEPQSFLYQTNIGLGLRIAGWGESVGDHEKDGSRTSSLRFGSDQKISLIREGRGYWKYEQQADTTTFLTQYDYDVRFGFVGRLVDRLCFRPLIGWATALSFDVLKRSIEKHESPHWQFIRFFLSMSMVLLFSFVWLYHGLVPKVLLKHPDEVMMIERALGISGNSAGFAVSLVGFLEIFIAAAWLFYKNKRHLFLIQILIFPLLMVSAIIVAPQFLGDPFNPVTFNGALLTLSVVGFHLSKDLPTASTCRRRRNK